MAVAQAGHAGPHPLHWAGPLMRRGRRWCLWLLRILLPFFLLDHIPWRAVDLPDQPLDPPGLHQRRRRLRLGVFLVAVAGQADQAGDLLFLGLGLMHPGAAARLARAHPPAIDFHGDHLGWLGHPRRQLAPLPPGHLVVAGSGQLQADLSSDRADVTRADLQAGQACSVSGVGVRGQFGGSLSDLEQSRRAVAVAVQTQHGPQGKKSRRQTGQWQTGSW